MSFSFFLLLGLLLMCVALGAAGLLHWRRARRAYEDRLRLLAERERVAATLHDTLLQSMQGMILRFQGVGHRLAADSPERATIDHILDQADEVLAEGRHQILALRVPVVYGDKLSQAFAAIGQSLQENYAIPFSMRVSGRVTPVNGDRGEDIYAIVREALYHAYQHTGATAVELELVYGCEFFSLYVRDNGMVSGAPPRALPAMRERAARLAGTVELQTLAEQGTEVALRVPGEVCYQMPCQPGWRHRLADWLRQHMH
ncbi:signal transduction histidine kinase [Duganella sp. 1224]|uniref:sensor histidine kinase n=1 Tax=Duganella sp. 1224 TaxID=2587052 RepID=UPI0015C7DEC9|nr:histidine kinase [Duganella sp. 1224]NYE63674.1 signal transduction histidine kinase [Duganella sp. 1224]